MPSNSSSSCSRDSRDNAPTQSRKGGGRLPRRMRIHDYHGAHTLMKRWCSILRPWSAIFTLRTGTASSTTFCPRWSREVAFSSTTEKIPLARPSRTTEIQEEGPFLKRWPGHQRALSLARRRKLATVRDPGRASPAWATRLIVRCPLSFVTMCIALVGPTGYCSSGTRQCPCLGFGKLACKQTSRCVQAAQEKNE